MFRRRGLTLTSVSRFQAGGCAKPDPRAERLYEVILDASRGPSGPAAMAAYREVLGSWRWEGPTGPSARPSEPTPQIGTPPSAAPPVPASGAGRIGVPGVWLQPPSGWGPTEDGSLFNAARFSRGSATILVDVAGESTPEEACEAQSSRTQWLVDPRPDPEPIPVTSTGGPAESRVDVALSDSVRNGHLTCFTHHDQTYVVTAFAGASTDPAPSIEAVLTSWTWA